MTGDLTEILAAAVESLGGEHREGQDQMAREVSLTLGGGSHLLVQAGTGTGKSLGYLAPAMAHAVYDKAVVVVATATLALQRQLVERDLPIFAQALEPILGRRPTYAVLKGRGNYICLSRLNGSEMEPDDEEVLFTEDSTSYLGRQAKKLRAWAEESSTGDRDDYPEQVDSRVWRSMSVSGRECVGRTKCVYGEDCFAEKARETVADSDIVITNHAMLTLDALSGLPLLPEHDAVIIDEGHELVDSATSAVTTELTVRMVERGASRVRRLVQPESYELLADASEALADTFAALSELTGRIDALPRDLMLSLALVRDACNRILAEMAADKEGDADAVATKHLARTAIDEIHDVCGKLLEINEYDVVWFDSGGALRIAPLSVAGLLREALFARSNVVLTSATLAIGGSFEPVANGLGLQDGEWRGVDVGSPFDYAKQGILFVPRSIPAPGRDGIPDAAYAELAELIDAAGGRTLALLSSWRSVEKAEAVLGERFKGRSDRPILVQRRGDSVADLVRRFKEDPKTSLIGTMTLWQGVDVPGATCTLVVIDRIPFPRPDDPVLSARQKAVDDAGGSGFRAVAVPRAGLLLAQGAGRLIRHTSDRGVVAVLDSRLATAPYAGTLRKTMPPLWFTTDSAIVREALRRLDSSVE